MPVAKRRKTGIRYHGNYCGPGWSGGQWQSSVRSTVLPIDQFDATCQDHDAVYADGGDYDAADEKFYQSNIGQGFKRSVAALAVKGQSVVRSFFSQNNSMAPYRRGRSPTRRTTVNSRRNNTPPNSRSRSRSRSVRPSPRPPIRRTMSVSPGRSRSVATRRTSRSSSRRLGSRRRVSSRRLSTNMRNRSPSLLLRRGVQNSYEAGDIIETPNCAYIGHTTHPGVVMRLAFFRALIKMILIKVNKLNPDWQGAPKDTLATDRIVISYRASHSPTDGILTLAVDVAALSQEGIADAFTVLFAGASNQLNFREISYRPNNGSIGAATINLSNAKVHVQAYSEFKMQNRSLSNEANDEADNIDNCPLIGRSYEGKGTGSQFIVDSVTTPFYGSITHGVIEKTGVANGLFEPPSPNLFTDLTGSKKHYMAPGVVQTSVLHDKYVLSIHKYVYHMYDTLPNNSAPFYRVKPIGKFRFFGMEKQLQPNDPTIGNDVKIAYEHDLKFNLCITPGTTQLTTSVFTQQFGV